MKKHLNGQLTAAARLPPSPGFGGQVGGTRCVECSVIVLRDFGGKTMLSSITKADGTKRESLARKAFGVANFELRALMSPGP
jgi:hypothetical protein